VYLGLLNAGWVHYTGKTVHESMHKGCKVSVENSFLFVTLKNTVRQGKPWAAN
jgi:hypothetical protein